MNCKKRCAANTPSATRPPIQPRTVPSERSKSAPAIRTGRCKPAKATTPSRRTTEPTVPEDFAIRPGTIAEAETVIRQRRFMFHEMGYRDREALDTMCEAFRPWLLRKMQAGEYLAWFAVNAGGTI